MGWWSTGSGDDVIGDRPADILGEMFTRLVAEHSKARTSKPTFGEMMATIEVALNDRPGQFLADAPSKKVSVIARLGDRTVRAANPDSADRALAALVRRALVEISAVYDESWERHVRLAELLSVIAFVLRAADDYVSDPPAGLNEITVEPAAG